MPSADQRIGLPQKPLASSFKLQVAFVCVQTLQTSGPGMKHMSALVSKRWKKIHGSSCRFTGTSRRNHGFFTAYVLEGCSCAFALPQGCFPLASHQASKPHEAYTTHARSLTTSLAYTVSKTSFHASGGWKARLCLTYLIASMQPASVCQAHIKQLRVNRNL